MVKKLLFYLGCALLVGGAFAFAWYAYLQGSMFRAQRAASRIIENQKTRNSRPLPARSLPNTLVIVPPRSGEPIGRIEIPRLHLSVMVLEGAAPKILRVAAGHVNGTALPGTTGNIGIAAHRDTFFRPLRDVRRNDQVLMTTSYGTFRYIVDSIEIVDPTDVQVLRQTPDPQLTLVTCYPFTYVGSAPKRFIVHARAQVSCSPGRSQTCGLDQERP